MQSCYVTLYIFVFQSLQMKQKKCYYLVLLALYSDFQNSTVTGETQKVIKRFSNTAGVFVKGENQFRL